MRAKNAADAELLGKFPRDVHRFEWVAPKYINKLAKSQNLLLGCSGSLDSSLFSSSLRHRTCVKHGDIAMFHERYTSSSIEYTPSRAFLAENKACALVVELTFHLVLILLPEYPFNLQSRVGWLMVARSKYCY
jgi:hypothetical protein